MKKSKKNKKAFTLFELLAVVVILGVIIGIIIPGISSVLTNSKKDLFISDAKTYISIVRNLAASSIISYPKEENTAKLVMLDNKEIELEKGGIKSPFGNKYDRKNSYAIIINTKTSTDPSYKIALALKDIKGIGINLILEDKLKREDVIFKTNYEIPSKNVTVNNKVYELK